MTASLPRPSEFLRAERQTPPRLLPLWGVALIALAGHVPGSTAWAVTAVGTLLLGLVVAPIMGSIKPTVVAYLWLLAVIGGLTATTIALPVGLWYDRAWLDQGSTGLLAMILLGAVLVGALTSMAWAALVLVEAGRRLARRRPRPASSAALAPSPIPVSVEPASSARSRRWAVAWRRAYVAIVCLGLAVPLPSFFAVSGVYGAAVRAPHTGLLDALGGAIQAGAWPAATMAWLVLGAMVGWLAWMRTQRGWRVIGLGVGAVAMIVVLLGSADFALVPGASGAQGFAPELLAYCPGTPGEPCPPAWLFDAPRLAAATDVAATWCALLLLVATAAIAFSWWRRRAVAGRASAPRS